MPTAAAHERPRSASVALARGVVRSNRAGRVRPAAVTSPRGCRKRGIRRYRPFRALYLFVRRLTVALAFGSQRSACLARDRQRLEKRRRHRRGSDAGAVVLTDPMVTTRVAGRSLLVPSGSRATWRSFRASRVVADATAATHAGACRHSGCAVVSTRAERCRADPRDRRHVARRRSAQGRRARRRRGRNRPRSSPMPASRLSRSGPPSVISDRLDDDGFLGLSPKACPSDPIAVTTSRPGRLGRTSCKAARKWPPCRPADDEEDWLPLVPGPAFAALPENQLRVSAPPGVARRRSDEAVGPAATGHRAGRLLGARSLNDAVKVRRCLRSDSEPKRRSIDRIEVEGQRR